MNKDFLKLVSKLKNVIMLERVIISRVHSDGDVDLITIKDADNIEEPLFTIRYNFKKKKQGAGKTTGGKPSYGKVYTEWLNNNPDVDIEVLGFMIKFINHIEWGTGRLIKNRSKKSLIIEDICTIVNRSNKTVIKLIKKCKELSLLSQTTEGYFISPSFIQKGVKK